MKKLIPRLLALLGVLMGLILPTVKVSADSNGLSPVPEMEISMGRYPNKHIKVFMNTKNKKLVKNYRSAMKDWNNKTCIKFIPTKSKKNASVILNSSNQYYSKYGVVCAVAERSFEQTPSGTSRLVNNITAFGGVLKQYRYNDKEIVLVLEHELGHVLGLRDTSNPNDLMYIQNRYNRITKADRDLVNRYYSNLPNN